jgi:hypothetical protein
MKPYSSYSDAHINRKEMIRNISGNLHIIRKLRHFLFEKTKTPKKCFVSKLNDIRLMNNHLTDWAAASASSTSIFPPYE